MDKAEILELIEQHKLHKPSDISGDGWIALLELMQAIAARLPD
jgi:hypothetical protein